ncbi:transcriptional activator hap3 [Coemansia sp. BCRC 34490]|nr:transcriptional activator hap3 [Coemansia sp. Benny D160-2]KAJ2495123.1 transcriptional activator hap3 [Coemansia sp. RSA 2049]KAJ2507570.1 transcriptional activator hap3 [Coemansia sp. RSA 1939]KAJ2595707.1 transcriptional activator hap3 [Coemansia sp. RSA 1804]KAJ2745588.1 transcriptional activator hap3 [Coemansia sp. BCRC 34490]
MSASEQQMHGEDYDDVKEQDRFLPIANVARIMKRALPDNAKIAKEAKETVQECVSEFISFITSEASDRCQQEKRKTINGEDVLWAMQSLGFENYAEALKIYLNKYRESVKVEKEVIPRDEDLIEGQGEGSTSPMLTASSMGGGRSADQQVNLQSENPSFQAYMGQQNPYYG